MLKSKSELNNNSESDIINIDTPGRFESFQINPKTSKDSPRLSTGTLYKIRIPAGLSLIQTNLILEGIRADLGGHAVVYQVTTEIMLLNKANYLKIFIVLKNKASS